MDEIYNGCVFNYTVYTNAYIEYVILYSINTHTPIMLWHYCIARSVLVAPTPSLT